MSAGGEGEPRVRAAGGLVVRDTENGPLVAVVHRPRHDDWSLPKGKLEASEGWREAAVREVEEETGARCEIVAELEPDRYRDARGREKLVRWYRMRPLEAAAFQPGDEVDEVRWLTPAEALDLLSYRHDRELARSLL